MGTRTKPKLDEDHEEEELDEEEEEELDEEEAKQPKKKPSPKSDDGLVESVAAKVLALLKDEAPRGGQALDEARMRHAVSAAMTDIRKEEAASGRLAELEAKVKEVVVERAPREIKRLTRLLWGEE